MTFHDFPGPVATLYVSTEAIPQCPNFTNCVA